MKTTSLAAIFALIATLALASCANTVRGIGQDVQETADAVDDVASE